MSVWTATPIARPPELRVDDLLGEHERRVVVAALAAVLLGLVEAEEAELAHAAEDRVGEGRLLPLLGVRRELLGREAADRLAQLLVLVGEDEVLALGAEVGLEDVLRGGGHARTRSAAARESEQWHCLLLTAGAVRGRRVAADRVRACRPRSATTSPTASRRSRSTSPTRATRCPTSCSATCSPRFAAARDDDAVRVRRAGLDDHETTFSSGGNLAGFAADVPLVHKHWGTERFPELFRLHRRARQAVDLRRQRARAWPARSGSRWPATWSSPARARRSARPRSTSASSRS